MTRDPSEPDLDLLRRQLGDAIFEAQLAEAREREVVLVRIRAAVERGMNYEDAAGVEAPGTPAAALRRWDRRFLRAGLAGLVRLHRGAPTESVRVAPRAVRDELQLSLGGVLATPSRFPPVTVPRRAGKPAAPLVRWAGSKAAVVAQLAVRVPERFERYHESFVGGGALFFALRPRAAFLSDLNAELVNLYVVARDAPGELLAVLAQHVNTREHYYAVRGMAPEALPPVERAARTLFLNRTCFNGVYRVNRHGLFNVPYGNEPHRTFFHPAAIREAHRALQGVNILCEDVETGADRIRSGDFVYLDPPYPEGLNARKCFSYQMGGFTEADQRRLAKLVALLDHRGALFMLSNADTPLVRDLYRGFNVEPILVTRRVGGRTTRRGVATEVLVRNYAGRQGALSGI